MGDICSMIASVVARAAKCAGEMKMAHHALYLSSIGEDNPVRGAISVKESAMSLKIISKIAIMAKASVAKISAMGKRKAGGEKSRPSKRRHQ